MGGSGTRDERDERGEFEFVLPPVEGSEVRLRTNGRTGGERSSSSSVAVADDLALSIILDLE